MRVRQILPHSLAIAIAATTACSDEPTRSSWSNSAARPTPFTSISASGEDIVDCAVLDLARAASSGTVTASVATPSTCSGILRIVVDSAVQYDAATAVLRVPVVLLNTGSDSLRDPVTLRWLRDSTTISSSSGLSVAQALSSTNADSVASGSVSALWQLDTSLALIGAERQLAPADSSRRIWLQFSLDSSVTAVRTTLALRARLKRDVYTRPPNFVPSWIYESIIGNDSTSEGRMAADVVIVAFEETATSTQRRNAVASVGGLVVGGSPSLPNGDGLYYVKVPNSSTPTALLQAADSLEAQPGVVAAMPAYVYSDDGTDYRIPKDSSNVSSWELSPGSAAGLNWALERINAPMAWGCSIGDASTGVAVIDMSFSNLDDLRPNVASNTGYHAGDDHGTAVASIIGAKGNNEQGSMGVMWDAKLRLYERRGVSNQEWLRGFQTDYVRLAQALYSDARVINISGSHSGYPRTAADTAKARDSYQRAAALFAHLIRGFRAIGDKPLIVVSAGNRGNHPVTNGEASWNTFPALVAEFPDQVLAVAATGVGDTLRTDSNRGSLVHVAAPGEQIMHLTGSGDVTPDFGQTSAAAPLVSGTAGLLFSFDPSLSAAEVRQLLIDGAVRGGRLAPDRLTGGDLPIVNAYESLKLAAHSPSAPLCGNHVWATDVGQVKVQRGPNWQFTDQVLAQIGMPGDYLYVLHGGRRILLAAETDDGLHAFDHVPNAAWSPTQEDPWDLPEWLGNVYGRFGPNQMSHDGDYTAFLQENGASYEVRLYHFEGGGVWQQPDITGEWQIGTVPRTTFDQGTSALEVYRALQLTVTPNGDGTADTVLTDPQNPYGSPSTTTMPTVHDWSEWALAVAPPGDRVYVGITRRTGQLQQPSQWAACEMSVGTFQNMPIEQCKPWSYVPQITGTDYYTVPMSTTAASVAGTALTWSALNKPGYSLRSLSVSEDGRELVIATGVEQSSATSSSSLWNNCGIQWVSAPGGMLNRSIPNGHACEEFHVGIVSPRRSAPALAGPMLSRSGVHLSAAASPVRSRNRKEPPSFADFLLRIRSDLK